MLDPSLSDWAVGIVVPGAMAGLVAHRWISAPLRVRRRPRWLRLAASAAALLSVMFALNLGPLIGIWSPSAQLARIVLVASLPILAGALPRLVRHLRARRVAEPAQSPYRARPAASAPSPEAAAGRRASLRLAASLAALTCIGAWAWASSRGEETWQEVGQPGAPRIRAVRRNPTATLLADGRVLVAGGMGPLSSCEIYDPVAGAWSDGAPMATARYEHTATLLLDGRVLVAGGMNCVSTCTDANSLATAEIYDPATGAWTPTAPMNAGRWGHAAARLSDGRVLVAGGSGMDSGADPAADRSESGAKPPVTRLRSAEIYDPRAQTWTPISPMTWARTQVSAFATRSGRVLITGEMRSDGDLAVAPATNGSIESFDAATATWTASKAAPTGMDLEAGTTWDYLLSNEKILRLKGARLDHAFTYDPATDTWAALAVQGRAHGASWPEAVVLRDRRVLASGGGRPASDEVSVFDPERATWSPLRPMALARSEHTAIVLGSGKVLVFGGVRRGRDYLPLPRYVMTSEVFDPATGSWAAR